MRNLYEEKLSVVFFTYSTISAVVSFAIGAMFLFFIAITSVEAQKTSGNNLRTGSLVSKAR